MEPEKPLEMLKRRDLYLTRARDADENAALALTSAGREMWESIAQSWRELAGEIVTASKL